jgi:Uma2 family endonuclease
MSNMPRISTDEYLAGPEYPFRRELLFGILHEPPSALRNHQDVVMHVSALLALYVWKHKLGQVYGSPLDVILDHARALVLQPDVMYISNERRDILGRWIHGAPDIAIEVESRGNRKYDRVQKLKWYRQYGVIEYWLVDPDAETVTVIDLSGQKIQRRIFVRSETLESAVLPGYTPQVHEFFSPA